MKKKLIVWLNIWRALIVYYLVISGKCNEIVFLDMEKYAYEGKKLHNRFATFTYILCKDQTFRNVVKYRLSINSVVKSQICSILFQQKRDCDIFCRSIGSGLIIYHGHGTIIAAHKVGMNFSIYQGATVGRNSKPGLDIDAPIIGNDVTVYTNAVVAGNIIIGDNVKIAAGAVVLKNVPSNSVVMGNPCFIKPI